MRSTPEAYVLGAWARNIVTVQQDLGAVSRANAAAGVPAGTSAQVPLPGAHLGLTWQTGTDVAAPAEVVALEERCRHADSTRLSLPPEHLARIFLPEPVLSTDLLTHQTLAGRAGDGTLVALGTVRMVAQAGAPGAAGSSGAPSASDAPGAAHAADHATAGAHHAAAGAHHVAAVRAYVEPVWRGRGIGRALLAWQDSTAFSLAAGATPAASTVIGVPIHASMVDRRRLYTAAGFSAATRIEITVRHLGDSPQHPAPPTPGSPAPGWTTRSLEPRDHATAAALLAATRDPHTFLASGLTGPELVAAADPAISRVLLSGSDARGFLLCGFLGAPEQNAGALISAFVVADTGDAPFDAMLAEGFLKDSLRSLWAAAVGNVVFPLTPQAARKWAALLSNMNFRGVSSDPLYTIELP